MRHPLPLLILAGLGMLAASGCQRAADAATEAAIERASGQQVGIDRDGERLRITSADGEAVITAGAGVALPADFPDDLFLPPSYGITSVMDVGGARLVSLESDGAVASMFEAARASMAGKGWSQTLAMQHLRPVRLCVPGLAWAPTWATVAWPCARHCSICTKRPV